MSNELRKKLHELALLVGQTSDPNTRALLEAIRLQTAVLNERLFAIERQVDELTRQIENEQEGLVRKA